MTETATFLLIPRERWDAQVADLARRAEAAARRHTKALPGDRTQAVAYEQLCRAVEDKAQILDGVTQSLTLSGDRLAELDRTWDAARPPWVLPDAPLPAVWRVALSRLRAVAPDGVIVEIRSAFGGDSTAEGPAAGLDGSSAPPPEKVWRSRSGGVGAVRERWRAQFEAAVRDPSLPVVVRSGIGNRVITPGLREYARRANGRQEGAVRIMYQDASERAERFPVGQLALRDRAPEDWPRLKVILLSARHSEDDFEVDAAWLLNSLISRPRPMAETDALADEITYDQLREITLEHPMVVDMYQTGFPPAIIGFYRAVARFLLSPVGDRLAVVPWVQRGERYQPEAPWVR